jgi:hypothetical protein
VACLVFAASSTNAQDIEKLQTTKTFRCLFTLTVSASMDRDTPQAALNRDRMELVFDQVDLRMGTARLIGNVGAEDVSVIAGEESITFFERTGTGNVQVTAIYMAQDSGGAFKAVHSRHTAMLGGIPIASQMYGSCRPLM